MIVKLETITTTNNDINDNHSNNDSLIIGRHEGLNMEMIESKTRSSQLSLTTLVPRDPLNSL